MFENYGWTEEIVVIDDKKIGSHREREIEREIYRKIERERYRKREKERERKRKKVDTCNHQINLDVHFS